MGLGHGAMNLQYIRPKELWMSKVSASLYRDTICSISHLRRTYSAIDTVYPKKYAHGFCFAVLCCGYTLTDFPISIRLTSLALWQSNDCPSASKATLMNMDKYFMWINYERLRYHNKAKHNKTVCIFLGIYCRIRTETTDTTHPSGQDNEEGMRHWVVRHLSPVLPWPGIVLREVFWNLGHSGDPSNDLLAWRTARIAITITIDTWWHRMKSFETHTWIITKGPFY